MNVTSEREHLNQCAFKLERTHKAVHLYVLAEMTVSLITHSPFLISKNISPFSLVTS
jgi:hypothetical protein